MDLLALHRRTTPRFVAGVVGFGMCIVGAAGQAMPQGSAGDPLQAASKAAPPPSDAGIAGDLIVGPGYRRVFVTQRQPTSPAALAARLAAGKAAEVAPATGELIVRTFADHLPKGWLLERPEEAPAGVRIDSLGNPIVNDTPGLPAWAQRDVDALRTAIAEGRNRLVQLRAAGANVREAEGVLGNYIGQAISRSIGVDDLVNIDDPAGVGPGVASSILSYLHFYENLRWANQPLFRYQYSRTVYPPRVSQFALAHGTTLETVQTLDAADLRGGEPSGCYTRGTFTRGMTDLAAPTDIWNTNGFDDESADIPTGFPLFFFYDCQDTDNNTSVRVSTNGYLSFFQQGGGATDGTDFTNDPIPNATDPDGFVAAWWDDLLIEASQGTPDRVSYKTEGATGDRVFTVEWFSVSRRLGDTSDFHYFQIKLYETTDVIEMHYDTLWTEDSIDDSTIGIENYSGAGGDCGPNCLNTNSAPPPSNYRFTPSPRPGNNACANAVPLIPGSPLQIANLHRATSDGDANCGSSSNNRDIWYSFTATCSGTLNATTCGSRDISGVGTGADTVLSAHSACPGTIANQLACSDDAGGAGCAGNDSAISVPMTAGQTILLRVTSFGNADFRFASGYVQLATSYSPTGAPANNSCANATVIVNNATLPGDLSCATADGSSDCGSTDGNNDIWYRFAATRPGTLRIEACGSRDNGGASAGPDTVVSIHTGCPGTTANQIACNDDGFQSGCDTLDSRTTAILISAGTYRIRVTHYGSTLARIGNGQSIIRAVYTCAGDWNQNGLIQPDDVAAFVNAWFTSLNAGTLVGDLDGNGAVEPADVSSFVSLWFATLTAGGC